MLLVSTLSLGSRRYPRARSELELLEEPELDDELDFEELELDSSGTEELDDGVGPVGDPPVAHPTRAATPASARLPERILRKSRRSSRLMSSSVNGTR